MPLHAGQIVDVAVPQTCCFRLHSKHSITELRCRFQKSSNGERWTNSPAWRFFFYTQFQAGFGANGEK